MIFDSMAENTIGRKFNDVAEDLAYQDLQPSHLTEGTIIPDLDDDTELKPTSHGIHIFITENLMALRRARESLVRPPWTDPQLEYRGRFLKVLLMNYIPSYWNHVDPMITAEMDAYFLWRDW